VYSEVGKGTAFRVYLPAIKTEIQETEEQQPELLGGGGERILVVEDEDSSRDVTFSTLELSGFKVLAANHGAEAVALYAENIDKIQIIAVSGLSEKDRLIRT
jgi:two-component system cell cycle sensor histidine kinase/response regulator CckA